MVLRTLFHLIEEFFFAHESITRGEVDECTCEVSKLLGISQFTCSRICRECVPHVEPSREGCPRSIALAQRQVCKRAIVVGGLDNVVNMRYALSEHLSVVVSTNTMRHHSMKQVLGH